MRVYYPESPKFRFFRQKQYCHVLTESAPVEMVRAAPQSNDDVRQVQEVKQSIAKAPPRPNEGAHRFLDQVESVHKWWTTPFAGRSPVVVQVAASAVGSTASKSKPHEPLDLQDVPETEQATGYKLDPTLQRKWFGNPAYAVQSREQKDCLPGAPFYPHTLVDSSTLKLADLLKIERVQLAVDKIKSPEFLNSKPVQDALRKVCARLQEGYGFDVNPQAEFKGDLQQMHRKYVFASVTVGKRFLQSLDDIRVRDLDKSADVGDDVALALGEFKLYAAIQDAHVAYHGRTIRKVTVKEIAIYIMAPYGFDSFGPDVPYLGHFNKKHFALVTDGEWVNAPVYTGPDAHVKNALMRPVSIPHYIAWRQKHNKGGDMLLFSERRPSFPNLELVVPLPPRFALLGRIAADPAGLLVSPFKPSLHFTLVIYYPNGETLGIDGQPTFDVGELEFDTSGAYTAAFGPVPMNMKDALRNTRLIKSNFYKNVIPAGIVQQIAIESPNGMGAEDFAQSLIRHAHDFASYTEDYSLPKHLAGNSMRAGEYNSSSYLAGLLNSVMGYVPALVCPGYQTPGWENPIPISSFKGEALR